MINSVDCQNDLAALLDHLRHKRGGRVKSASEMSGLDPERVSGWGEGI